MAKLSIIIPVYNMKEQERQCLLSIRQTVRLPYEIIVVDDGSSADERILDAGTADNFASFTVTSIVAFHMR